MAKIPNKIKKIVDKYLAALKENNISFEQVILYGSYAKGNYNKLSDIDIVLVSKIFKGNRFLDKNKIRKVTLSVSSDLEVLPYSPKDFRAKDPLIKEILSTGVKIV